MSLDGAGNPRPEARAACAEFQSWRHLDPGQALPLTGLASGPGPDSPFPDIVAAGCVWSACLCTCGHSSWELGWATVGLVWGLSAPGPLPRSLLTPALSCGPGSATTLLSGLGWGPGAPSPSWGAWLGKSRAPGLRAPGQCHGLPGLLSLSSLHQPAPTKSTLLFCLLFSFL